MKLMPIILLAVLAVSACEVGNPSIQRDFSVAVTWNNGDSLKVNKIPDLFNASLYEKDADNVYSYTSHGDANAMVRVSTSNMTIIWDTLSTKNKDLAAGTLKTELSWLNSVGIITLSTGFVDSVTKALLDNNLYGRVYYTLQKRVTNFGDWVRYDVVTQINPVKTNTYWGPLFNSNNVKIEGGTVQVGDTVMNPPVNCRSILPVKFTKFSSALSNSFPSVGIRPTMYPDNGIQYSITGCRTSGKGIYILNKKIRMH